MLVRRVGCESVNKRKVFWVTFCEYVGSLNGFLEEWKPNRPQYTDISTNQGDIWIILHNVVEGLQCIIEAI